VARARGRNGQLGRVTRISLTIGLGIGVGLALTWWGLRHGAEPSPPTLASLGLAADPAGASAAATPAGSPPEAAERDAALDAIAASDDDALLHELEERLRHVSDRDLLDLLEQHTQFARADAEGLRDLRAYTLRLAEIGLAADEESDAELPVGIGSVAFGRFLAADGRPRRTLTRFAPGAGRLFAVFPEPEDGGDHVTVRWTRRGEDVPLLLARETLGTRDGFGSVWLRPEGAWKPGLYRVDVYSGDEQARRVASGSYRVEPR